MLPTRALWVLLSAPVLALGCVAAFAVLALANLIDTRSLPEPLDVVLIGLNWNSPGFGLVAQLFVWPFLVALGGVLGDLLAAPPWKTGGMFRGGSPQT